MSIIFLDPAAMDSTAGAVGEHAREVESAVTSIETSCAAQVPPHLAAWLAEELRDIAVVARMAALLYTVAALDTALRAQQIRSDQSLAAAWPSLDDPLTTGYAGPTTMTIGGTGPAFTTDYVGPTTMTIGGTGPAFTTDYAGPTTMTIGGTPTYANDPLLAMAIRIQDTNPGLAAEMAGVGGMLAENNAEMGRTWTNSRPGASYVGDGLYAGDDGRTGPITAVYRNPDRPGEYEVHP